MKPINKIYNEQIIAWSKKTEFQQPLPEGGSKNAYRNPLCGDEIFIELTFANGVIDRLNFQTRGCVLSKASSNLLASRCQGMTIDMVDKEREEFISFLNSDPEYLSDENVPYAIFNPVRRHRSRHACLLLPYDAILEQYGSLRFVS